MKKTLSFDKTTWIAILGIALVPPSLYFFKDFVLIEADCSPEDIWRSYLYSLIYSLSVTYLLFFGNTWIFNYAQRNFPWDKSPSQRLIREIPAIVIYTTLVMGIMSNLFLEVNPIQVGSKNKTFVFENILIANSIALMVVLFMEGYFFFKEWQEVTLKSEQLEKERVKAEFNSLKAQINPHFLFNSLNSLLALVKSDPDRSESFIIHLSKVYRYVLDHKEQLAVPLREELEFADSYMFLHKIRFGNNLQLEKSLGKTALEQFVPPLTLQLLLENAVKHNVISSEKPLTISVRIEGDQLVIRNNFQPRTDQQEHTGLGQDNLIQRYQMLGGNKPQFEIKAGHYEARVPLFENSGEVN